MIQCRTLLGLLIIFLFHIEFVVKQRTCFALAARTTTIIERSGCYHNGSLYADRSFVPTLEPCLNCKCNTKTLVCSLKICPEMPVPPPRGCVHVQKKNTCCPYLSCLRFNDYYNNALSRRIASYLDHYERESIDRVVNDNFLQKRSDDYDFDGFGDICVKNGTVYKSGSAMSSSSLCSYCYCIGGQQRCVKPKCMLPLEGCKPVFVDSTCCPVRYDCSVKTAGGKSWQQVNNKKKTNNKHYQRMSQRLQRNRGCHYGNNFYMEGQKIPSDNDKPCDICFCIRGKRKCAPKKCAPSLRSCIPVIPKGQCCPSSYDCGPSAREWDRTYQSRQIGLFSWILDSEEDVNNSTDSTLPESDFSEKDFVKTTSEKSIFDVIREGLEIIDSSTNNKNNNVEKINKTSQISKISTTNNSKKELPSNKSENNIMSHEIYNAELIDENDDINLFDLFLQTVTNVTSPSVNTTTTTTTTTSTTLNPLPSKNELTANYKDYDGVSFFDIFLGKTEKNSSVSKHDNLNGTEAYDFDYFGLFNDNDNETYDYLSVSDSTLENESTNVEENDSISELNSSTTDTVEARSEIFENTEDTEKTDSHESSETTTFRPEHEETIQSNEDFYENNEEDYLDSEERNFSTTSNENYSTEDIQVGSFSTEEDSVEELSTIKNALWLKNKIANYKTTTVASIKIKDNAGKIQSTTSTKNLLTKPIFVPTKKLLSFKEPVATKVPQIFKESSTTKIQLNTATTKVLKKVVNTQESSIKPEVKPKISFLSTVIDELQSLIRKSSNVTTIKPNEAANNHSATNKINENVVQEMDKQNANISAVPPFKRIITNHNLNHILNKTATTATSEPITIKPDFTTTKFKTVMSSINVGSKFVATTKKPDSFKFVLLKSTTPVFSTLTTSKPLNLNSPVENEEYGHKTLPPSLPNLEIIPFLPIDALPLKEKLVTLPTYPTMTERHGSAENIWSDLIDDVRPFKNSDSLSSLAYSSSKADEFSEANHNRFSPPKETEGGFVPKQPIVDGNLYYGTKLITELTTIIPSLGLTKTMKKPVSTEKPIAITSVDPFKDVIKTEPPPDLDLLIEDKEKRLGSKNSAAYDDKQIIHITTDANYIYDSDLKKNNVVEFSNINFEDLNITEGNDMLMENFPLDRHENVNLTEQNNIFSETFHVDPHENVSFTEKSGMLNYMFDASPNVDSEILVQPLENDVLAENFPLDRRDDYKKINNLTFDNVDMMIDDDYVDGDNAGFGSFLDYFLGANSNAKLNLTTTNIPPFKVIPSNLPLLPSINSEIINEQLQSDIKINEESLIHKNNSTDLSILGELLKGNNHKIVESELYKPKLQRPFSLPNITGSIHKIERNDSITSNSTSVPDPFKGLPSLIPSYPIKKSSENKNSETDIDLILTHMQKEPFTVGGYKVLQNKIDASDLGPYVVNPINIEELKKRQQQKDIQAQIFSKPEHTNSVNDPAGILKLAGCNIYGRMYRVGRIISELSNACLECKCTEIGVNCTSLECSITVND